MSNEYHMKEFHRLQRRVADLEDQLQEKGGSMALGFAGHHDDDEERTHPADKPTPVTPDSRTRLINAVADRVTSLERGLNELQMWGSGAQVQLSSLERKVDEGLSAVNQRCERTEKLCGCYQGGDDQGRPFTSTRDDEQSAVLAALAEVWERYPSLRLGQLIQNVIPNSWGETGVYHFGDKMMLEALERYPETED